MVKETAEIEQLLRKLQNNGALSFPGADSRDTMHHLLEIATTQGKDGGNPNNTGASADTKHKNSQQQRNNFLKKGFDPCPWLNQFVRQGVRLDLGLTKLEPEEV